MRIYYHTKKTAFKLLFMQLDNHPIHSSHSLKAVRSHYHFHNRCQCSYYAISILPLIFFYNLFNLNHVDSSQSIFFFQAPSLNESYLVSGSGGSWDVIHPRSVKEPHLVHSLTVEFLVAPSSTSELYEDLQKKTH